MDGEIIISDNLADVAKMQHRGYVTHALCVSAKYLSEVCKRVSGQSAFGPFKH